MNCLAENIGKREIVRARGVDGCHLGNIFAQIGSPPAVEDRVSLECLELTFVVERQCVVHFGWMTLDPALKLLKPIVKNANRAIGIGGSQAEIDAKYRGIPSSKSSAEITGGKVHRSYLEASIEIPEQFCGRIGIVLG